MHINQNAKRYRLYSCMHVEEKLVFFRISAADGPLRDTEVKAEIYHFFQRKLTSCATLIRKKLYKTLLDRKLVDPTKSTQSITSDPCWVVRRECVRHSLPRILEKQRELVSQYSDLGYLVLTTRIQSSVL